LYAWYHKEKFSRTPTKEYANSLWNSYQKQDIKALEKIQMRSTRLVTALRDKPYQELLRALDLPTLKFRRLRGDMIETYKVLSGIYDTSVAPEIPIISEYATQGNSLKIANCRCHKLTTFGSIHLA